MGGLGHRAKTDAHHHRGDRFGDGSLVYLIPSELTKGGVNATGAGAILTRVESAVKLNCARLSREAGPEQLTVPTPRQEVHAFTRESEGSGICQRLGRTANEGWGNHSRGVGAN